MVVLLLAGIVRGDEKLPPPPPQYFSDNAHVTQPATQQELNDKLRRFEADTSSQVVVAIYATLPDGQDLNQYCTHLFQAWHVGQKGKDNGVGLFVFIQSRQMFIVTGYGMEGSLPDATCEAIIENDIKPHFKTGDYDGGVTAGINAILAATRGEYHGNGHTAGETNGANASNGAVNSQGPPIWIFYVGAVLLLIIIGIWRAHHTTYSSGGRRSSSWLGFIFQTLFSVLSNVTISSGSGGGGSGGGGFSGGGGGFSGGGGSTGGGGAGGSW